MLELDVQQLYFDAIAAGMKTIEGRLAKQKYMALKPGDNVRFTNPDGSQSVVKEVVALHTYPTFADAFKTQDFQRAIPTAKTVDDAIHIYERFYPGFAQQEFGIVFIELK